MNPSRTLISRSLVALAFVGSLGAVSAPVWSQPASSDQSATATDPATRQARFREHMQTRLDRMAERLKITADQQPAWTAYRQTVEGLIGAGPVKPAADADAAAIARLRAQRAAEHAQKLSQLADATAALQQALTPEQQTVLNEMARRSGRPHHGKHRSAR